MNILDLTALELPPAAALDFSPCLEFPVIGVKQPNSVWCWAAVGLSLLKSLAANPPTDLCPVVMLVLTGCPAPCDDPQKCIQTADVQSVLGALPFGFQRIGFNDQTLKIVLGASDPIVSEISEGSDTHLVIVHGYCPDTGVLTVLDTKEGWDNHSWHLKHFPQVQSFHILKTSLRAAPPAPQHAPPDLSVEDSEPAEAAKFIAEVLPAILARSYGPVAFSERQALGFSVGSSLPLQTWSAIDVLKGEYTTTALGWRHLLYAGDTAIMVIDSVIDGGAPALRKASTGRAVNGIDEALHKLADEEPEATEVQLLQVPCLDLQAVSFRQSPGLGEQIMVAYSVFSEFEGLPTFPLEDFVSSVRERAVSERVTSRV